MKSVAEFRQALRGVIRLRRRSVLMALSVAIGVASITVLNSVGENTRRETIKRVKNMLGTFDTVLVRPGAGRTRGMVSLANVEPVLKFPDAEAIAALPTIKQVARLQNAFDIDVTYRDRDTNPAVFGVSANWLDLRDDQLTRGSFFTSADERALARDAIVGTEAQRSLFADQDPLGQTIRIGGVPFQVRGILASRGAGPAGGSLDNVILIPVTTASRRLFNRDFLTMIIAQLRDLQQGDAVVHSITALLRERHRLAPTALDDFTITNPKAVMEQMTSIASTLSRILTGVAFLAMLIGGVVIMCLMIVSVSERRTEIGLRRSVGANRGDILFQFLLEAAIVSTLGGMVGAGIGLGGANAVAMYQKLPVTFSGAVLVQSLAMAVGVGLTFGIYPAWRASRLDPVAALRV